MLNGEEWKEKRAEITPAFTQSKVRFIFCDCVFDNEFLSLFHRISRLRCLSTSMNLSFFSIYNTMKSR